MSGASLPGKVLILHPDLSRLGGIETSMNKIIPHLNVEAESFVVGRRPGEPRGLHQAARMLRDANRFAARLDAGDVCLVHANPSLDPKGLLRESLLLRGARKRGIKTLVFLRGWREPLEKKIDAFPSAFRALFGGVDAFMVLGSDFETALRRWGLRQPVYRATTVVDDAALEGFDLETALAAREAANPPVVLFAGRVMREKGIVTLIRAAAHLENAGLDVALEIAGDGPDVNEAKRAAADVAGVRFLGRVEPNAMRDVYTRASLLCLPTQAEGLPNVLVEAMAFALPVVTCPVGAIGDVFTSGENGLFVEPNTTPEDLAGALGALLEDAALRTSMSRLNHDQARRRFLASSAARDWERIYREITTRPSPPLSHS